MDRVSVGTRLKCIYNSTRNLGEGFKEMYTHGAPEKRHAGRIHSIWKDPLDVIPLTSYLDDSEGMVQ